MAIQDYAGGIGRRDDFVVEVLDAEGPTFVKLSGDLDISSAPELRARLEHFGEVIAADVVMDLDHLTFLDSCGISVIVMTCKRIRAQGGSFSASCSAPQIRRVLELTGLLEYLHMH
ncbi:MAG TPA: STAS domain-containing protein [Acidimicrobiales bacterium]|jgi:anti-sigma B factor antagonist|nr:STAS domain-containing protein [Acidimicrobiales bacterium]